MQSGFTAGEIVKQYKSSIIAVFFSTPHKVRWEIHLAIENAFSDTAYVQPIIQNHPESGI
ncbi:hypothetical protein, partial [uncultured Acetatifactor sp.]|jgi:hypothetical protein|uniref:hypothetical protein n=1 Tax=uncultured Acetatifactor sp. TaxID=1671927 RepID=UPI002639B81E